MPNQATDDPIDADKDAGDLCSSEFDYLKRDPEEEFFMLAVLALKMVHTETYEDAEYVYEVSAAKLFRQVRNQNMPFHRWYKWLEDKFKQLKDAAAAEQEPKEELSRWNEEAEREAESKSKKTQKKKGIFDKIYKFIGKDKQNGKEMKKQVP